jgi:hypothetical protein
MDCERADREDIAGRYLSGTLEAGLIEPWEEHYFACDVCADRLESLCAIVRPLRATDASIRAELSSSELSDKWFWAAAALAAMLVLGVATADLRTPPHGVSTRDIGKLAELARVEPPAFTFPVMRGIPTQVELQFQDAMRSYPIRDYARTIADLRAVLEIQPEAVAPRFFLGACYLLTARAGEGIRELRNAAAKDSAFVEEARFYLAKGYLMEGRKHDAVTVLGDLAAMQGELSEVARRLAREVAAAE